MFEPRQIDDIQREIYRQLAINGSQLTDNHPGSVLYSLTRSFAGMALSGDQLLYELSKDFFLATATGRGLEMRAAEYGVYRKKAQKATGYILVRPREENYTVVAGLVFTDLESNIQLISTNQTAIKIPEEVEMKIPVVCTTPGRVGNLPAGTVLTTGVNSRISVVVGTSRNLEGTVLGGLTGGVDEESDESLRNRARIQFLTRESSTEAAILNTVYSVEEVNWATLHQPYPGHTQVWLDINTEDKTPIVNQINQLLEDIRPVGTTISAHVAGLQLVNFDVKFRRSEKENYDDLTADIMLKIWKFCTSLRYGETLQLANLTYQLKQIPKVTLIKIISPETSITPYPMHLLRPGNIDLRFDVY